MWVIVVKRERSNGSASQQWFSYSAMVQLYHGENNFIFNGMLMKSALYYTNNFYSESVDRHVVPLGHIILIASQPSLTLWA